MSRGRWPAALIALQLLGPARLGQAEDDVPALLTPAPAPYPEALRGRGTRGTVEVTVEVDRSGRVLDATPLGAAPAALAQAALTAARGLRFAGGRRGQNEGFSAVVAYAFTGEGPAHPRLESVFYPQSVSVLSRPSASRQAAPGATRVDAEEARRLPGTQGDPNKAVEDLPGVARVGLGSADVVLWGGAPGDSRVLVDGIEIPALFHLGGLRGVVAPALVAGVEVVPGAYGATHGRSLGGLVLLETPTLPAGVHGGVALDPLDASAHLAVGREGGPRIAGGWREGLLHRLLAGSRLGRPGQLLALPAFRDQHLKASLPVSQTEELEALVLASRDSLERTAAALDPAGSRSEIFDRGFVRAALRYRRSPDETGAAADVLGWVGSDRSGRDLRFGSAPARLRVASRSLGLRAWRREQPAALGRANMRVLLGFDGLLSRSRVSRAGSLTVPAREGDPVIFGQPPGDEVNADEWRVAALTVAPFVSAELDLGPLALSAGARLEAQGLEVSRMTPAIGATPAIGHRRLDWTAEPRLALTHALRPWLRLQASGGRYHQLPAPEDLSAVFGTPLLGPARADQVALGGSLQAGWVLAELTTFAKRLSGLAARDLSASPALARVLTSAGRGQSTGLQTLLRWSREPGDVSGWVAHTWSRSVRQDSPAMEPRLADFDQTHVLVAVAEYRRGAFTFGGRGRWATGAPRTPVAGSLYEARTDRHVPIFGAVNSVRLGSFFQLDLRAERAFHLGSGSLDGYLELLNLTARRNAEELAYSFDYSERQTISGLPFLALAGGRLRF